MKSGIFFNNVKQLPKKNATDPIYTLFEIMKLLCIYDTNKNVINKDNIGHIVSSLKYYIFERKQKNLAMKWEARLAQIVLEAPQLEPYIKEYLGVDVTDIEMANSPFGQRRPGGK